MLCPEVLNPKFSLKTETKLDSWRTETSEPKISTKFGKSELLQSIQIFLPNTLRVPNNIIVALTNDSEFYKVERNFPLCELLEEDFINNFVKQGKLNISSIGDPEENHVYLTPDGTFCLKLNNHLCESIIQLKSFFTKVQELNSSQTIFELDVCKTVFKKSRRDKFKECLKLVKITCPVIIIWEPPEVSTCPSSVASYLEQQGVEVMSVSPSLEQLRRYNLLLPLVDNDLYTDWDAAHLQEVEDWLGALSLDADVGEEGLQSPSPHVECGQMAILKLSGFTTTRRVWDLVKLCSSFMVGQAEVPWVGVVGLLCSDQILSRSTRPVVCTESAVTVFAVRSGRTVLKRTQTIDYSA